MKKGWMQLLEDYGINYAEGGGADFAEMVLRLVNGWRWTGQLPPIGELVRAMAAERGCTTQQLYSEMKAALHPLLVALEREGVPANRLKTTVLAATIAEKEIERLQAEGLPKPKQRTPAHWKKRKEGGKYTVKWQGK